MGFIISFDLSLTCSGYSIFKDDGTHIFTSSIETKVGKTRPSKLNIIGTEVLKLKNKYNPNKIIIEQGFSRFAGSTEAIFEVVGVVSYLFSDTEQIFYAPTTVKKTVGGRGNMKKDELRNEIFKKYPNIVFKNMDESDSFAVGQTYFIKEGVI